MVSFYQINFRQFSGTATVPYIINCRMGWESDHVAGVKWFVWSNFGLLQTTCFRQNIYNILIPTVRGFCVPNRDEREALPSEPAFCTRSVQRECTIPNGECNSRSIRNGNSINRQTKQTSASGMLHWNRPWRLTGLVNLVHSKHRNYLWYSERDSSFVVTEHTEFSQQRETNITCRNYAILSNDFEYDWTHGYIQVTSSAV
jgi:hypothetical protein